MNIPEYVITRITETTRAVVNNNNNGNTPLLVYTFSVIIIHFILSEPFLKKEHKWVKPLGELKRVKEKDIITVSKNHHAKGLLIKMGKMEIWHS